jgi:hypothetical protein
MTTHTLSVELTTAEARRVSWRTSTADLAALEEQGHPLWVACAWDARPPTGLAGRCDGRLRGSLSRQLLDGKLSLALGEVTLVGVAGRLAGAQLLLFGLGSPRAFELAQAGPLGRETAERIHKIGWRRYALEVVWLPEAPAPEAHVVAAEFVAEHLRRRLELLGSQEALSVTWILPDAVRMVVDRARSRRPGLRRRCRARLRRVTFFRRRRKK